MKFHSSISISRRSNPRWEKNRTWTHRHPCSRVHRRLSARYSPRPIAEGFDRARPVRRHSPSYFSLGRSGRIARQSHRRRIPRQIKFRGGSAALNIDPNNRIRRLSVRVGTGLSGTDLWPTPRCRGAEPRSAGVHPKLSRAS
ncbi:unnamed protein product [Trichogramma brassicae]|uniref:Uncharacterized protein n=1 Tax=Trichogramma brassicae TaxID=86971 RepID=A0A6H5IXB9_9HYME|nr:unnamed protein product [Trichogramma brassicae]